MRAFITALAVCGLMMGTAEYAAACTWNGEGSTCDWSDADNWSDCVPDTAGESAIIASKTGSYWPCVAADTTIGSLTMHNGTSATPRQITVDPTYTLTVSNASLSGQFEVSDTDSEVYVEKLGTGTISCASFTIVADDNNPATVKVTAGTISTY